MQELLIKDTPSMPDAKLTTGIKSATGIRRPILLAAGGTGGHLFPAEALAEVLTQRGELVELVTDTRVESWVERFPGEVNTITAGTVTGTGLVAKLRGLLRLLVGLKQAHALLGAADVADGGAFGCRR